MLDVNLGNKTLVVGVLVALILSYGMINFNKGAATAPAFPRVDAAVVAPHVPASIRVAEPLPANQPLAQPAANVSPLTEPDSEEARAEAERQRRIQDLTPPTNRHDERELKRLLNQ